MLKKKFFRNPPSLDGGGCQNKISGQGCPYFAGQVVGYGNDVLTLRLDLANEWDYEKNELGPENYTLGSEYCAYWKHLCRDGKKRGWRASIGNRACKNGTGCPFCARSAVSLISQACLDILGIPIENREISIKVEGHCYKVDGFDPETKIVYEFLGGYFHGDPVEYSHKSMNTTSNKTFGQLYDETFKRFDLIKEAGYNLVYIWEYDFLNLL